MPVYLIQASDFFVTPSYDFISWVEKEIKQTAGDANNHDVVMIHESSFHIHEKNI